MTVAYIKPLVLHFDQLKQNMLSTYEGINLKDLTPEDKEYLLTQVLPIIGKNEPFIQRDIVDVLENTIPNFKSHDIWEKYNVVHISEIIDYIQGDLIESYDFGDEDSDSEMLSEEDAEKLVEQIINIALEKRIYSFKYDW